MKNPEMEEEQQAEEGRGRVDGCGEAGRRRPGNRARCGGG